MRMRVYYYNNITGDKRGCERAGMTAAGRGHCYYAYTLYNVSVYVSTKNLCRNNVFFFF